ncbi:MAG: hypothetical protein WD889_02680 [Candidatus Colwellbacteria bacterium]
MHLEEKGGTLKTIYLPVEAFDLFFWGDEGVIPEWLPKEMVVHVSEDVLTEMNDIPDYPLEERLGWTLGGHLREKFPISWWEYVSLRRRQKKMAFLLAHGGVGRDGEWYLQDGNSTQRMQEWIDEHDGKFACLVIFSCNPGHITVSSRRSLLVIADRDVTLREGPSGYSFSLIDPKLGEVDDYTIDHRLNELRGKKREKSTKT